LATAEQMLLHFDAKAQRAAPAPQEISDRARRVADAHASLPRPDRLGRAIRSTG
jgi:carnitine 3-dehydrogenase